MNISAVKILQTSLEMGYKNWYKLLPYLIMMFLPTLITVILAIIIYFLEVTFAIPAIKVFGDILITLVTLAGLLVNFWAIIALVVALKNTWENQPTLPWKQGLKATSALLVPAALSSLLASLIIFVSTLLFIIPGIITFIWFLFTLYVVLFEQATVTGALKKSKILVVGQWWQIAWSWFLPFVVYAIAIIVINLFFGVFIEVAFSNSILWNAVTTRLVESAVWIALSPAVLGAPLILYLEIKKAKNSTPTT